MNRVCFLRRGNQWIYQPNLRPSDTEENVDLISSRTGLKLENINGRKADDSILTFF